MLVKVTGGIGESGENQNFTVGFSVAVGGGTGDLGLDEVLQLGELAVTLGGYGLGFLQKELKLRAVIADLLKPPGQIQMGKMDAAASADGEVILIKVRIFELVGSERVVVDLAGLIQVLLERRDALFKPVDFVDGPLHRQPEGVHGAFEAFEQIDLHHGDKDLLAALLGETPEDLVLISGADFFGKVIAEKTGRVIERQAQGADLNVQLFKREETRFQINGGVYRFRSGAFRKAAELLHLARIVRGDLAAGACDTEAVQQLEEIAADRGDQLAGLALIGRALGPVGEVRLRLLHRFFHGGDAEGLRKGGVGNGVPRHVGTRDEGNLVAQVGQLVVDRGGGEQQDFCADAL
ncbi:MAG: hypothetical protein BWY57_03455 [Betaproteobacteria bacterium ADurb.Bin341]|nr:MAG: hypothetical protein BWY57_03455 [Betaproteobacteria bacterium ADurb.Bin341]